MLNKIVATNIRKFRIRQGITQEELAYLCGLHRTYIGSVERGERNITLSTLSTIAQALKISPRELLKET